MIQKLLLIIRLLFLKFSDLFSGKLFNPGLKLVCLGMFFVVNFGFSQITQRGSYTTAGSSTGTLTINKPSGVISGDIMIVNIAQQGKNDGGSTNTLTNATSTGWILISGADLLGGQDRWGTVLYKIAGNAEPSSYSFTLNSSVAGSVGSIIAFSGVDVSASGPFDVTPSAILVSPTAGGNVNVGGTALTTVSNNAAILMFGQAADSAPAWETNSWSTATSPGALTELYNNQVTIGTPEGKATVGAAWAIKASAGSTGAGAAKLVTAQRNGGLLIALKPRPTITPTNSLGTYTFCIDNTASYTTANAKAGEYALVNVIKGFTYNFSVNNGFSGFNEYLTVLDATTNADVTPITYSSGASGTNITGWVSSISGQVKVVLSTSSPANNGTSGTSGITVTQTAIGNIQDDQTFAGSNVWRGHVYNFTSGAPPGTSTSPANPANTDPFGTTQYVGYYDVGSETISSSPQFNFGGNGACFPVFSDGAQRVNIYTEQFAVRYRMTSSRPAGCYMVTVKGDDGVRLYIDNVKVFDEWKEQSTGTYGSLLVYLDGNSDFILDYYENGGTNEVSFSITPFVSSSNTVTVPTVTSVCSGTSPGLLDGSAFTYNGSSVNKSINYQWQSAPDAGGIPGTWSNVTTGSSGTVEDYTPATVTTTTTTNITWYRRTITAAASGASACTFSSNEFAITTSPATVGGTVAATPAICSGTQPGDLTLSGHKGTVLKWQRATNTTFTAGLADITVTTTTLTGATIGNLTATTYFRAVVQNGNCATVNSAYTTVTVNTIPTITNPSTTGQTLCSGATATALSVNATAGTGATITNYKWYSNNTASNSGGTLVQNINSATTTNSYTPSTAVAGMLYYYAVVTNSNTCTATSNVSGLITVNGLPTITTQPTNPTPTCSGSGTQIISVTATGAGLGYTWRKGSTVLVDGGVISGQGSNTLTLTNPLVGDAGSYNVTVTGTCSPSAVSNLVTVTVNSVSAPTVSTIVGVNCTGPGSVLLTNLPTGNWTINQTGTGSPASYVNTTPNTTSYTVTGLALGGYYFTVNNGTCTSAQTAVVNINDETTATWNGTSWTGGPPTATKNVIINSVSTQPFTADTEVCSLTINSTGAVIIPTGVTLKVNNALTTNNKLIFENNSSLMQNTNAVNTGNITYKRIAPKIRQADFVYWSTPVSPQTLFNVSQLTMSDKFFYNNAPGWIAINSSSVMEIGKGYIIRGPETYSNTVKNDYEAWFIGVPNNGDYSTPSLTVARYHLIGNPYPSALSVDKLIDGNTVLNGAVYLWTHNTSVNPVGNYNYNPSDYATYNRLGSVGTVAPTGNTSNPSEKPTGFIGAGQAFFVSTKLAGPVNFTNSMREAGTNNSQFFKSSGTSKETTVERDRVWLNLISGEGAFKQLLVGYTEGATNGYENRYDAVTMDGNTYMDFYSMINANKFTIQGRALPFVDTDIVPLGYRTSVAGTFTISIDEVDGKMSNQAIFIEDKVTGVVQDLRYSNYTFTSAIGAFTDRLVLRYTGKTLGTGDFENVEDGILVSVKNKVINVISSKENIKEVTVYDITGKQLYNKKKVGNTELQIQNLPSSNQVLFVKITLANDFTTTRKVIFQ